MCGVCVCVWADHCLSLSFWSDRCAVARTPLPPSAALYVRVHTYIRTSMATGSLYSHVSFHNIHTCMNADIYTHIDIYMEM